jgi:hypothetical protein
MVAESAIARANIFFDNGDGEYIGHSPKLTIIENGAS